MSSELLSAASEFVRHHHAPSIASFLAWKQAATAGLITRHGTDAWTVTSDGRLIYYLRIDPVVLLSRNQHRLCYLMTHFSDVGNSVFALAFDDTMNAIAASRSDVDDCELVDAASFAPRAQSHHAPVTVCVSLLKDVFTLQLPRDVSMPSPRPTPPWGAVTVVGVTSSASQQRMLVLRALDTLQHVTALTPDATPVISTEGAASVACLVRVAAQAVQPASSGCCAWIVEPLNQTRFRHQQWRMTIADPRVVAGDVSLHVGSLVFVRGYFTEVSSLDAALIVVEVVSFEADAVRADYSMPPLAPADFARVDPSLDDTSAEALQADLLSAWWVWNTFTLGTDPTVGAALKLLPLPTAVAAIIACAATCRSRGRTHQLTCLAERNKASGSPSCVTANESDGMQIGFFVPKATAALLLQRVRAMLANATGRPLANDNNGGEALSQWPLDSSLATAEGFTERCHGAAVITELLRLKPHDVDIAVRAKATVIAFSDPTVNPAGALPAKMAAWTRRAHLVVEYHPVAAAGYQQVVALRHALHFQSFSPHAPASRDCIRQADEALQQGLKLLVNTSALPPLSKSASLMIEEYFKFARRRCPSQVGPQVIQQLVLTAQLHAACCSSLRVRRFPERFFSAANASAATLLVDAMVAVTLHDTSLRVSFGQSLIPTNLFDLCPPLDCTPLQSTSLQADSSVTVLDVVNRMWALFRSTAH